MATLPEATAMAVRLQEFGDLAAAERIFRQILAVAPNHALTWQRLSRVCLEANKLTDALDAIGRAISLDGRVAALHSHQGNVYQALGQPLEAAACYRRAVEIEPGQVESHYNLGIVLAELRHHGEAVASYRRAVELQPEFAEAHHNLGVALGALGRRDEALASCRRARELQPDDVDAQIKLGVAFAELAESDEALACFRRALALRPDDVEALANQGIVHDQRHEPEQAAECYRRALALDPRLAVLHNNLGNILHDQGDAQGAIACYQQAVKLEPDYAEARCNLGNALVQAGNLPEAIASYRHAIDSQPTLAAAYNNLGNALVQQREHAEAAECFRRAVELEPDSARALAGLVRERQHLCQWDDLEELAGRVVRAIDDGGANVRQAPVSPFILLGLPSSHEQQLRCAQQWVAGQFKLPANAQRGGYAWRATANKPRISIGYLAGDFHEHALAELTTELFEKHDRRRFEIVAYSYGPDDGSPMRRRLVQAFDRFVDVERTTFAEAARHIADDGIDILVDLMGFTQNARAPILALRPAPVQVSYLGYPGTLGSLLADYILVDPFVVPADQQPFFTERLVHLRDCYQVNDSRRAIADATPSRTECGLPAEGFVFCSFNSNYKIMPDVFGVWMNLLRAVPGSVLWLLAGNRVAVANLRREAAARGVAAERLVFAPHVPLAEHLARQRRADLFLDTLPYNAHTTASESLWAGCPVLSVAGATFASRVAGSLLTAVGLPELITANLAEYEALALRLAREPALLAELRERLQNNRNTCSLFDGGQFAHTVERAYATMWEIFMAGDAPRSFSVSSA